MLKVLHFYKSYYPDTTGGVEQVIYQLAEGGTEHGIEAQVLSLTRDPARREMTIDHHSASYAKLSFELASTGFSTSVLRRFHQLAEQADLIHYHFPWPFMDLVHYCTGVRKPALLTYHSDIVKQRLLARLYRPLMNRFLSSMDAIVASSPQYAQSSPVLQSFRDRVTVIPFGLSRKAYPKPADYLTEQWRGRVGEDFFLFVGQLRYYKGLNYLLEAARGQPWRVVIVGEGAEWSQLRQKTLDQQIDNVVFLGSVDDKDKLALLELCRAFVFPSHLRSEAFGIALLEASMLSRPMITCEIGTGTSYVNLHNETGLVVAPADPVQLRQAMQHLYQNPELAMMMGRAAGMRFEQHFSSARMTSSYIELYQRLVSDYQG